MFAQQRESCFFRGCGHEKVDGPGTAMLTPYRAVRREPSGGRAHSAWLYSLLTEDGPHMFVLTGKDGPATPGGVARPSIGVS
ncbi:hypothetical protein ACVW19_003642 [Streptomyces sp. TE5632]